MQDMPYIDLDALQADMKGNRARDRRTQPENNNMLVLIFFILVIATYTAIVSHRFHMPDAEGTGKAHRKHLRLENAALREQFQSHVMNRTRSAVGSGSGSARGDSSSSGGNGTAEAVKVSSSSSSSSSSSGRTAAALKDSIWSGSIWSSSSSSIRNTAALKSSAMAARGSGGMHLDMAARQQAVRGAMQHAWRSYEKYAWGKDELQPISRRGKNSFAGMGATILDSLSTLWIMGLRKEFARGRKFVAATLQFPLNQRISLFETNIRVVGGLLSAYDLSEDAVFLRRARELVDLMLPAMGPAAGGTGIPKNIIILGRQARRGSGISNIAECGSLQLEWCAMTLRTGNSTYAEKSLKIFDSIHSAHLKEGLIPTMISRIDASGMESYSMGANSDSFYEYLLKVWMLRGKKDEVYRAMWEQAVDEAIEKLVGVTAASNLTFIGSWRWDQLSTRQEHLACFFPGNIALGVHVGAVSGAKALRYMQVAAGITHTCWQMYDRMPSGLAPEAVVLDLKKGSSREMVPWPANSMLRPETVESFFYMWRITGEPQYREWGWKIFQSIEKNCKVKSGYAGSVDVTSLPPVHDDTMQSFFLAETLKYLYLLFSPPDVMPLDEWVFNTEAHPIRLPKGAPAEIGTERRRKLA